MLENMGWLFAVALGPVILGGAMLYAYSKRRRLTRREKSEQHEAVQELYEDTAVQRARREREDASS